MKPPLTVLIVAAVSVACAPPAPEREVVVSPPNVLLVSIDTLRADHVSAYGYHRETTPTLDELSATGLLFEDASAHSCKTAISHMTLFTGLLPEAHGVVQPSSPSYQRLSDSIPTLAGRLSAAGFRTGGITENGGVSGELGFDRGMESYTHEVDLEATVKQTTAWLEDAARDPRPFFLFVHTYAVHDPYSPPEPWLSWFREDPTAGSVDADVEWRGREGWEKSAVEFWNSVDRDNPADLADLVDLYDGGIRWADDGLLRILEQLDRLDLRRDTVIVVLSDHGEEFLDHGMFLHEQLYEEILRVPMVIVLPARFEVSARRVPDPVRLVDLMPTLLELLDIDPPPVSHGRSLVPVMAGENGEAIEVSASWGEATTWSLRLDRWKLVRRDHPGGTELELYDLESDPGETQDLAAAQSQRTRKMAARMVAIQAEAAMLLEEASPGSQRDLSWEVRRRLQALGYVN